MGGKDAENKRLDEKDSDLAPEENPLLEVAKEEEKDIYHGLDLALEGKSSGDKRRKGRKREERRTKVGMKR